MVLRTAIDCFALGALHVRLQRLITPPASHSAKNKGELAWATVCSETALTDSRMITSARTVRTTAKLASSDVQMGG